MTEKAPALSSPMCKAVNVAGSTLPSPSWPEVRHESLQGAPAVQPTRVDGCTLAPQLRVRLDCDEHIQVTCFAIAAGRERQQGLHVCTRHASSHDLQLAMFRANSKCPQRQTAGGVELPQRQVASACLMRKCKAALTAVLHRPLRAHAVCCPRQRPAARAARCACCRCSTRQLGQAGEEQHGVTSKANRASIRRS